MRAVAEQQARGMRAQLETLAASDTYGPVVRALRAQPGVGSLTAIRLVLELGTMERFSTTASLPHYLGLTPSEYSTGIDTHRGHILKCGPGSLRAALVQCAWVAVRRRIDSELVTVFDRLSPRIGRKRAIVAVARQLAIKLRRRWLAAVQPQESTGSAVA
jgi:transposase